MIAKKQKCFPKLMIVIPIILLLCACDYKKPLEEGYGVYTFANDNIICKTTREASPGLVDNWYQGPIILSYYQTNFDRFNGLINENGFSNPMTINFDLGSSHIIGGKSCEAKYRVYDEAFMPYNPELVAKAGEEHPWWHDVTDYDRFSMDGSLLDVKEAKWDKTSITIDLGDYLNNNPTYLVIFIENSWKVTDALRFGGESWSSSCMAVFKIN